MKKRILTLLFALLLCLGLAFRVFAATDANLYDEADLLTDAEESRVAKKLTAIGEEYDAQLVVMTVPSAESDVDTFVEEVYDGMNMGYGEDRDGVLLLLCMDSRDYRILSNGYAGKAIGSEEIDAIGEAIVSDLSDGSYADAFLAFGDECGYYLNGYLNGFPFPVGEKLIFALAVGIVAGVIVALVLKGQLKSVRPQRQANVYVKPGSMKLNVSRDLFLYRNVTRTKKQSSSSSGAGSGSSRSVGGGKF